MSILLTSILGKRETKLVEDETLFKDDILLLLDGDVLLKQLIGIALEIDTTLDAIVFPGIFAPSDLAIKELSCLPLFPNAAATNKLFSGDKLLSWDGAKKEIWARIINNFSNI